MAWQVWRDLLLSTPWTKGFGLPAWGSPPSGSLQSTMDTVQLSHDASQLGTSPSPGMHDPTMHEQGGGMPLQGTLLINGSPDGNMPPGKPAVWTLSFTDPKTGQPITDFDKVDTKYMHLIVVSSDFSSFAHVHPRLNKDGTFSILMNGRGNGPDNQQARNAIPKPGTYYVFAEVQPHGGSPQTVPFTVNIGNATPPAELQPDPVIPGVGIRKYFNRDGSQGQYGSRYQVTTSTATMMDDQGKPMLHITFNIQEAHRTADGIVYKDVKNVQPWLGMPGHAFLISQEGGTADQKMFMHLHPGDHAGMDAMGMPMDRQHGGSGPDFTFMIPADQVPPDGLYKLWGQFRINGKVLTFPFVIQLGGTSMDMM